MQVLQHRFFKELQNLQLRSCKIAVACSGGLDSMVLLELLHRYERSLKLDILTCHIDHAQREDSPADKELVQKYCQAHKIAFKSVKLRLPKQSSEAMLRTHRYLALKKLAGNRPILTAHHADDQLETFLFRLIRGSHPDTLQAMAVRTKLKINEYISINVLRPLLPFFKDELQKYAFMHHVPWREDLTNQDLKFSRNQIRHKLVPLLETLRPGAKKRILTFFITLVNKNAQYKTLGNSVAKHLCSSDGVNSKSVQFLHLKRAIDELLNEKCHQTTQTHWNNLAKQLLARQATRKGGGERKKLQFPGGNALLFQGDRLFWVKK